MNRAASFVVVLFLGGVALPAWGEDGVEVPPPSVATPDEKTTVIVLDPNDADISPDVRLAVSNQIGADLGRVRAFSVATAGDIRAMLELEANRQLAGCTDESCLSEVAEALGADIVVTWGIGNVGETEVVSVTLFDAVKQAAAGRGVSKVGDGQTVLLAARDALRTALDATQRSRGTISAKSAYELEQLSVLQGGDGRVYAKSADMVPIDAEEFYAQIDRPDLAKVHAEDKRLRQIAFWVPMGVAVTFGVTPAVFFLAGSLASVGAAIVTGNPGFLYWAAIGAYTTVILTVYGAALVGVGALIGYGLETAIEDTTPFAEDRALAKSYNRRLAQDLGLDLDVDAE